MNSDGRRTNEQHQREDAKIMDNTNPNGQNNGTDSTKVLEEAQARYYALAREGDNLGAEKARIQEESMARSMDEALANGDVQGAMSSAMSSIADLEQRERELPYWLHVAEVAVLHAMAAVAEEERAQYAKELEEVFPLLKPAREKAEAAAAEWDELWSRYESLETREDRALVRRSEAEGQARDLRQRGPSLAPLGGVASPLGEAVDRRTSMRNIRNPNRDGMHGRG